VSNILTDISENARQTQLGEEISKLGSLNATVWIFTLNFARDLAEQIAIVASHGVSE